MKIILEWRTEFTDFWNTMKPDLFIYLTQAYIRRRYPSSIPQNPSNITSMRLSISKFTLSIIILKNSLLGKLANHNHPYMNPQTCCRPQIAIPWLLVDLHHIAVLKFRFVWTSTDMSSCREFAGVPSPQNSLNNEDRWWSHDLDCWSCGHGHKQQLKHIEICSE